MACERMAWEREGGNWVKGTVAGVVGGLAGAWVMNRFQSMLSQASKAAKAAGQSEQGSGPQPRSGRSRRQQSGQSGGEPSTVKLAETVSRELFKHPLSRQEKQVAGPAVHYGYAMLVGGLYGALAEETPVVTMGAGVPYAAGLWLLGDEMVVPILGLSKPPTAYPASTHASALAAHLVFGLALDLTRRVVRHVI